MSPHVFILHMINVLEQHSVEYVPPPGRTVYVLYPTDRLHLDPDLHQNRINSFLAHTLAVHQVVSKSVHNCLKYPAHRQTNKQTSSVAEVASSIMMLTLDYCLKKNC